jgi:hypothetical protein
MIAVDSRTFRIWALSIGRPLLHYCSRIATEAHVFVCTIALAALLPKCCPSA